MTSETGKWLIIIGVVIVLIGLIFYLAPEKLNWLGRLPGDVRIEREGFRLFIPITTMLLLSIVLTVVIGVINKLLK